MISQDQQGWRVYQVSQAGLEAQDSQVDLVSLEPKVSQALLELDHQDQQDSRYKNLRRSPNLRLIKSGCGGQAVIQWRLSLV